MPKGRPRCPVVLSEEDRLQLSAVVRSRSLPHGLAMLTQCKKRHRHQEYLQFLKHIEENVPQKLEIHVVVDNYSIHKHAKVKRWLAAHERWHVHYTPTYASWLNQVEIWFNIITQKAIRRGTFRSVKELIAKIQEYVDRYNQRPKPFAWNATADSIFEKLSRYAGERGSLIFQPSTRVHCPGRAGTI
jgi:transposase